MATLVAMGRIRPACVGLIFILTAAIARPAPCLADGWHNAALYTRSLDQWVDQNFSDLKAALPNLKEQIGSGEVRAGRDYQALEERAKAAAGGAAAPTKTGPGKAGALVGKLNLRQQALMGKKAGDCLEILACMSRENIIPQEFPTFQLQQIPKYREAAKNLLKMMGPAGGQAVTSQLRSELMGNSPANADGLAPHPDYIDDLLEVLKQHMANGTVSLQDLEALEKAAAGMKTGRQVKLAQDIQKALAEIDDIHILLNWADQTTDSKRRQQLSTKVRGKLKDSSVSELLAVLNSNVDSITKDAATRELESRWSTASPLELLQAIQSVKDPQAQKNIAAALAEKSPKYADVRADLPEIWKLARLSTNPAAASAAREQMVNAFLRAPVGECLDWLTLGDTELTKLIWEQMDDRISRADAQRKAGYREVAVTTLKDHTLAQPKRIAAIDLLARLKDRNVAGEIIEMLPLLPQELRPRVGKLLRDLTGQNFGPFSGDGTAEVAVAVKKWRDWWKANGGN